MKENHFIFTYLLMLGQTTIDHSTIETGDAIQTESFGKGPPPLESEDDYSSDRPEDRNSSPFVSNALIALLTFLGAEAMFFAGLIGAFIVFRFGNIVWPPPMQPRLPVEVTGLNTVLLLFSAYTMYKSLRALRNGSRQTLIKWLILTASFGLIFLSVQGYEWLRLVSFGLTLSSGVYGSIFYTLVGCHALHVLGAVSWLMLVLLKVRKRKIVVADISPTELKLTYNLIDSNSQKTYIGLELCSIYWYFVVGLWPILYVLVYLN